MQLSRGAGLAEILGMQECEKRQNYTLLRPLLFISKDEISSFLKEKDIFISMMKVMKMKNILEII